MTKKKKNQTPKSLQPLTQKCVINQPLKAINSINRRTTKDKAPEPQLLKPNHQHQIETTRKPNGDSNHQEMKKYQTLKNETPIDNQNPTPTRPRNHHQTTQTNHRSPKRTLRELKQSQKAPNGGKEETRNPKEAVGLW